MPASVVDKAGRVKLDHMVDVFKALGHPVRLDIMRRMVQVPELACTELEHTLPVSKPTISYHIKLLRRAQLINVKTSGKHYFYTARIDEMNEVLPGLVDLLQDRLS